jgi:hypothetical protein
MSKFDELAKLVLNEASLGTYAKRVVSPSSWRRGIAKTLHGAGTVAGALKDPYKPAGPEAVSRALKGAANIISPDPSTAWAKPEEPATLKQTNKKEVVPKFNDRDYFNIVMNGKVFAGKIIKVAGEYVFVKLFKHPQYGSAVALVKQRVPELFFYKEKIPKGKSRYIDSAKATITYNNKKRHWVAMTK